MTRLESAAWPVAGGGASVFVTAVVLNHAPWQATFVFLAAVVAAWSLRAPLIAGVLVGGMAWLFLTGFDINADGELRFTGWADLVRLGVLIAAGLISWVLGNRPAPDLGVYDSSGISDGRYHQPVAVPRPRDVVVTAAVPGHPAEESRDD